MFIRRPAEDEAHHDEPAQDQFVAAGDGDDGPHREAEWDWDDDDGDGAADRHDQPLLEQTSSGESGDDSDDLPPGSSTSRGDAQAQPRGPAGGAALQRAASDRSILKKRNYTLDSRGRASPTFMASEDNDGDVVDSNADVGASSGSLRSLGSAGSSAAGNSSTSSAAAAAGRRLRPGAMKRRVSFTGDGDNATDDDAFDVSHHTAASELTDASAQAPPPARIVGRSASSRSLPGGGVGVGVGGAGRSASSRSLVRSNPNNPNASTRSLMSAASASSAGSKMIKGRGSIGFVVASDSVAASQPEMGSAHDQDHDGDDDADFDSDYDDDGSMYRSDFFANDTTCVASTEGNGSGRSKSMASRNSSRWRSAMSTSSVRTIISGLLLFQGVDDQSLDAIVASFEKVEYDADDEIIRQGDPCHDPDTTYMYVVTKGECAVKVNGKVLPDPYGTLTRDAIFGELSIMNDSPRKATITAKTNCSLQRVSKATVKKHLPQDPSLKEAFEKERDELKRIDDILDKIAGVDSRYGGDIIHKFKPQRLWLWTRWRYTVLAFSYPFVLFNMTLTGVIALAVELSPASDWTPGHEPDQENPIIMQLNTIFGQVFNYLMTLATFVLTFYLSEAFGLWKQMYFTTRKIQAGLNEIMMMLAIGAVRDDMKEFTPEAEACLDDVAHFVRLYHLFMWGKFSHTYGIVITEKGMSRMLTRGLITNDQFRCLQVQDDGISAHHTCIEWIGMRIFQGMEEGGIKDDTALKMEILNRINFVRSSQSDVGDIIDGRMSLAYAHLVQMLVDVLLITSPFAVYAQQGIWAILTVGVLTVFYAGVLDLSKMYLDPLDNDGLYDDSVNMDLGVLMNEMNLGAAEWKKGAMFVPF